MGLFTKIKDARGTRGGLYVTPGNYVFRVKRCIMKESFKGDPNFIAELETISSQKSADNDPLAPNSAPSYVVNLKGKYPDLALGNVADFMRAGLASLADQHHEERPSSIEEIEVDEEIAEAITGESNLLAGVYLAAHAFNHKTRDDKDFTRVEWSVPPDLEELLKSAA